MAAGQASCLYCHGSGWVTVNGKQVPCGFYGASFVPLLKSAEG